MRKLNGFTVESRVLAKCPEGHSNYMIITNIVEPTDDLDVDQYTEAIKLYLKSAYAQLLKSECQTCKKEKETYWTPKINL